MAEKEKTDCSWAVHICGPDDIVGPYTEIEAHRKANEINNEWLKLQAKGGGDTPLYVATVLSPSELEQMNIRFLAERKD